MNAFQQFYKDAPRYANVIENATYNAARNLSQGQYEGGQWVGLTSYINYPDAPERLLIGFSDNYVEPKEISNKAFGVYVALVVFNQLCWMHYTGDKSTESEYYGELYHKVRNWLLDEGTKHITQDEVSHILRMID